MSWFPGRIIILRSLLQPHRQECLYYKSCRNMVTDRLRHPNRSTRYLININRLICHEKSLVKLFVGLVLAAGAPAQDWKITAVRQVVDGKIYRLFGAAEVQDSRMLFRADEIEYDSETGDLHARGSVYFYSFESKEKVWATRVDYNTLEKAGKFYNPRGESQPRIVVRAGVLTGNSPFYFEGEWAERIGEKFILYNGWITNCKLPNPWWLLRGPKFDIILKDR